MNAENESNKADSQDVLRSQRTSQTPPSELIQHDEIIIIIIIINEVTVL